MKIAKLDNIGKFNAHFENTPSLYRGQTSGKEKVYDLAIIKIKQYMPKIEHFWAKFTLNFP